jgi:hypothetical protein
MNLEEEKSPKTKVQEFNYVPGSSSCLPAPVPTEGGAGRCNLKSEMNMPLLQPQIESEGDS